MMRKMHGKIVTRASTCGYGGSCSNATSDETRIGHGKNQEESDPRKSLNKSEWKVNGKRQGKLKIGTSPDARKAEKDLTSSKTVSREIVPDGGPSTNATSHRQRDFEI